MGAGSAGTIAWRIRRRAMDRAGSYGHQPERSEPGPGNVSAGCVAGAEYGRRATASCFRGGCPRQHRMDHDRQDTPAPWDGRALCLLLEKQRADVAGLYFARGVAAGG